MIVETGTQIKGIQFWYPEQTTRDPGKVIEYPPTITRNPNKPVFGVSLLTDEEDQTVYRVGDDDYKDYSSIQDAVEAAETGDIVYVYSGLYRENLVLEKEITIRSISGTPEKALAR